jgi:prepilin-type processing-associated H-X9-DG protein
VFEIPQDYPHGLGANILYGDGHVEFDDDPNFAKLASQFAAQSAAGDIPATMPSNP